MKRAVFLIPLSFLMVGCPLGGGPGPQPPEPGKDPIALMCQHLQSLGCEEGEPVYNDSLPGPEDVPNQSCVDFYGGLQKEGITVNPKCVATAPSCDLVEDYRLRDPEDC
jgi:hypothetical protein